MTRPNLAPLALILAVAVALERPRAARAAVFSAAVVPGCVAIGILNSYLYGSPLSSGYGSLHALYTWHNLTENARNYFAWFVDLHSGLPLVGLVAPALIRARRAWLLLAFAGGVLLSYLFYFVYDSWIYLRFLLPAIPLFFVLSGIALVWFVGRVPAYARGAVAILIVAATCWSELRAQHFDVFTEARNEERFVIVGK
jgi:hypothetical protein